MKIVIVGNGTVGFTLTEQLAKEKHDIVVIDTQADILTELMNRLDVIGVHGNGASYAVLKEAGVGEADLVIAVTASDEINMLCCMVAKKLGVNHTIARVRNPEYADQLLFMKEELGLSLAINPELAAANEVARLISFPAASSIDTFSRGRVELVGFRVEKGGPLDGLPLLRLNAQYGTHVLVCAVLRNNEALIPSGNFVFQADDKVTVTGKPRDIVSFFQTIGMLKNRIRNTLIIGGGMMSYYLARVLQRLNIRIKIIEQDQKRCEELCELLPKAVIIHGNGTDEELLLEEGLETTGAFVALTNIDEENLIVSMYARTKAVPKVIAKMKHMAFPEVVSSSGIDSTVSPKHITSDQILRYVRAMQNSMGSNVETLHKIVENKVEALEFKVRENADLTNRPLRQLSLKPNLLIACIIRGRQIIIPGGDDVILPHDSVIVVTTNESLHDLKDILK